MVYKKEHKRQVVEGDIVTDILCNICGESLQPECSPGNFEGVEARLCGGYGSLLGDGIQYEFAICEKCLKDKIFPMFKHPPTVDQSGWLGGGVCDEDGNAFDAFDPKQLDIVHDEGEPPEEFLDTPDKSNTPV